MRLATTLAAAALCLFALAPRVASADDIFPLDLSGTRPALSISIGEDAPELWVFDTGAGGSAINIDRARALNLPELQQVRIGSPVGGTPMQGFLTTLSGARIGDVALPALRIAAVPTILPDRTGVLSPNAFAGRLVTLDFARNELRITDKTAATTPSGEATAYHGAGPHALPAIEVAIGDGPTQFAHIDSGAPGGLTFPYAMAASLPLAAPPVEAGHARFVDGVRTRYSATLQGEVRVGPLTLVNPEIELIDGLPYLNVGMRLLRQMTITLDPAEQRVWAQSHAG